MSFNAAVDPQQVTAARGRLHLSRAGFLYAGQFEDTTSQRHSVVLYLALGPGAFEFDAGDGAHATAAALFAPGIRKRIHGGGTPIASVDVTPTHRAFPTLARAAPEPLLWSHERFASAQDDLTAFRSGKLDTAGADALYRRLVDLAVAAVPAVAPLDPRVKEVMNLMRARPGLSTAELAKAVSLSKDWLVHLFQREVGIPLRKYEQALMVQVAAAYLKRGVSLTEVAATAGFADSAHFSRIWKQHFGFPPQRAFAGDEVFFDPMPWPPCTAERAAAAT